MTFSLLWLPFLWKSESLLETAIVFWKLKELFVMKRSLQLGFNAFLKQVFTIFLALYSEKNCGKHGFDSSVLISPTSINLS